jgi:hypothetical protein
LQNQTLRRRLLEVVWSKLSERRWRPIRDLETCTGADSSRLTRIIDFLVCWEFAEVRHSPTLQIRRKPGTLPPVDVVEILGVGLDGALTARKRSLRLAERVACCACGFEKLRRVDVNEVECEKCNERQWYSIEISERRYEKRPNSIQKTLARLGFPQFAFSKNNPKPTRYYYFMCNRCKRISSDYAHGFSRYFNCPHCGQ